MGEWKTVKQKVSTRKEREVIAAELRERESTRKASQATRKLTPAEQEEAKRALLERQLKPALVMDGRARYADRMRERAELPQPVRTPVEPHNGAATLAIYGLPGTLNKQAVRTSDPYSARAGEVWPKQKPKKVKRHRKPAYEDPIEKLIKKSEKRWEKSRKSA